MNHPRDQIDLQRVADRGSLRDSLDQVALGPRVDDALFSENALRWPGYSLTGAADYISRLAATAILGRRVGWWQQADYQRRYLLTGYTRRSLLREAQS